VLLLSVQSKSTEINMNSTTVVTTKQGKLRGKKVMTANGVAYFSFQGIPYAKPPIGALRFKVSGILYELLFKLTITLLVKEFHVCVRVKCSLPFSENLPFNFPDSVESSLRFPTRFL
jgi:hypothetical protein